MDADLTTLLEIQDLKGQLKELSDPTAAGLQSEHFNVDLVEMSRLLNEKIAELTAGLEPRIRKRYERIAASLERAVVPVIGGVCYGCYVSIATATGGLVLPNDALRTCEGCGRFIYILS